MNGARALTETRVFGDRQAGIDYTRRPAAYVVIFDGAGSVACVSEGSGLFLPGGGLESGEDAVAAIHREVAEECARGLEVEATLEPAIQFHLAKGGRPFELHASFFTGRLAATLDRSPEYEIQWLPVTPGVPEFFHACHGWAVEQALGRGPFPFR